MSDYQQFLNERDKIDFFLESGYKIKNITENLSGAFVEFEKMDAFKEEKMEETLHVQTAEGRKYFSVMLINQQLGISTA